MQTQPLVVSFGGGVDSTAMLVEMRRRDIVPDLILFADTGGEKPETYEHVQRMSTWCVEQGFPAIETVRYRPDPRRVAYTTLEGELLKNSTLPSLAFGMKSCSLKWKVTPQHKYVEQWTPACEAWAQGIPVVAAIGLDNSPADRKRAKTYAGGGDKDMRFVSWYPLQQWELDRTSCEQIIRNAALPVPLKSCCFFCPAHHAEEITDLRKTHPILTMRALEIEQRFLQGKHAGGSTKGLGRRFTWQSMLGGSITTTVKMHTEQ